MLRWKREGVSKEASEVGKNGRQKEVGAETATLVNFTSFPSRTKLSMLRSEDALE